jgi:hypothetical protein
MKGVVIDSLFNCITADLTFLYLPYDVTFQETKKNQESERQLLQKFSHSMDYSVSHTKSNSVFLHRQRLKQKKGGK